VFQPGNVKPGAVPLPNATMVHEYNSFLSSAATTFSSSHPGTKAMVFDSYTFLSDILDNPAPYGIKNTTGYCLRYDAPDIATNYAAYGCLPIDEYFWYNTGHITYKVHEYLAKAVGKFLESEGC
jgi:phospholipase/lecithinase/hemolysin